MGKLELLNDDTGRTSTPRVILILWTVIPLTMWVIFSFAEGRFIPFTELDILDDVMWAVAGTLMLQYAARGTSALARAFAAYKERFQALTGKEPNYYSRDDNHHNHNEYDVHG